MGARFKNSVKLAPGIRMNFCGSHRSVSITVEDDGQLVFRGAAGLPLSQGLIDHAWRHNGASIAGLIKLACEKLNRDVEALGEIHLESPSPHGRPAYQPAPFTLPEPAPPIVLRKGVLDQVITSRWLAKELQNTLTREKYEAAKNEWNAQREAHRMAGDARRNFIECEILESDAAMEKYLEAALKDVQWPRETNVSFDVSPDGSSVALDVDLPEIEDMPARIASVPARIASVPARGCRLSIREMEPAQKKKLYMAHVHGVGFRVIAETFAALPMVRLVTLSAHSRADNYLYAVRIRRDEWSRISFEALGALDVTETLAKFDLRRKMSKTGTFSAIEPFERASAAIL